jgi:hypothetical protein
MFVRSVLQNVKAYVSDIANMLEIMEVVAWFVLRFNEMKKTKNV